MDLELSLKQTLKLSPQMLQSMEILQMSTLELGGIYSGAGSGEPGC